MLMRPSLACREARYRGLVKGMVVELRDVRHARAPASPADDVGGHDVIDDEGDGRVRDPGQPRRGAAGRAFAPGVVRYGHQILACPA